MIKTLIAPLSYLIAARYFANHPWNIMMCDHYPWHKEHLNSLATGKSEWHFRYLIFQIISVIDGWGISCEVALRRMSLDFTDDKPLLEPTVTLTVSNLGRAIHANFVIIAHELVLHARKNAHIQSSEQYIYGLTSADLGIDRWILTSRCRVMVNPKLESESVCDAHGLKIDRLEAQRAVHSWILIRRAPYRHR